MATPGQAVPGSVVAIGSQASPAGAQGIQGPTGVSTDAGNIATLGSDSLVLVPQSTIWYQRLRSYNAIGNPTFEVDQKLCGAAHGLTGFSMDRWTMGAVGNYSGNAQQITANVVVPGTNFFITSKILRLTLTTAATLGATDYLYLWQAIEGPQLRELMGDVHSVSLLVRSTVANLKFGMSLQDTGTTTRTLAKLCTLGAANTWTLIPLANLPVWTASGTFSLGPGSIGYYLNIVLAVGSSYIVPANDIWQAAQAFGAVGQSNFAASPVNSTFDIAFCQHEPGSQCTTLIDCPFGQNLNGDMGCLRYFCKNYGYGVKPGTAGGGWGIPFNVQYTPTNYTIFRGLAPFPKELAAAPTLSIYNDTTGAANSVQDYGGVNCAVSNIYGSSKSIIAIVLSAASSYGGIYFDYTADTGW